MNFRIVKKYHYFSNNLYHTVCINHIFLYNSSRFCKNGFAISLVESKADWKAAKLCENKAKPETLCWIVGRKKKKEAEQKKSTHGSHLRKNVTS